MLYKLLFPLANEYIVFNVFKYITFRTFGALLTALAIYFLFGERQIVYLKKWQIGQVIREDGPKSHQKKAGTPTMGGVGILLSAILSAVLWMDVENAAVWWGLALFAGLGALGFYDDYRKLRFGSSKGLAGRYKFLGQVLIAGIISYFLLTTFLPDTRLSFPFFKTIRPELGVWYLPFAVLVIVGASNAVNLTDGLDGLATGPSLTSFLTLMILAYLSGHVKIANYLQIPHLAGVGELSILCAAVIGSLAGFLWYNTYPAEIFMGDVGSLPLGGLLGYVAVATKNEVLLIVIGGIFVLEAVSVMTQVLSFRLTGKRIFRMAPLHHHFELKGWSEPKIIVRFWIVSFVLSLLAMATLKLR